MSSVIPFLRIQRYQRDIEVVTLMIMMGHLNVLSMSNTELAGRFLDELMPTVARQLKADAGYYLETQLAELPDIWETRELPSVLANLTPEERIAINRFDEPVNLQALAVALGLDRLEYYPSGLEMILFAPPDSSGTVLISSDTIVAFSDDDRPVDVLTDYSDEVKQLNELMDEPLFELPANSRTKTRRVSALLGQ